MGNQTTKLNLQTVQAQSESEILSEENEYQKRE
jgi:hypothetical protein